MHDVQFFQNKVLYTKADWYIFLKSTFFWWSQDWANTVLKTNGFYKLVHFVFLNQDYWIWLTVISVCYDDKRGCGNKIWKLAHSKSKQTKANLEFGNKKEKLIEKSKNEFRSSTSSPFAETAWWIWLWIRGWPIIRAKIAFSSLPGSKTSTEFRWIIFRKSLKPSLSTLSINFLTIFCQLFNCWL